MLAATVIYAALSYLLMVAAFFFSRVRYLHMTVMVTIMVSDLFFPVYLYMNREWGRRLFDEEEIFSFLIWMHVILIITLYLLYFLQIQTARGILKGSSTSRSEHHNQARGILIVRALVIITGALLVEPEQGA